MKPLLTIPNLPKRSELGESHLTTKLRDLQLNFKSACAQLNILTQRRTAEKALRAAQDSSAGAQSNAICPVCMDDLHTPHAVITLCGHVYHRECLDRHFKTPSGSKCPMCRRNINPGELIIVRNGFSEVESTKTESIDIDSPNSNAQQPSGNLSEPIDIDEEGCDKHEVAQSDIDQAISLVLQSMHDLSSRTGIFIELEQALRRENQNNLQDATLELAAQKKKLAQLGKEYEKKLERISENEKAQDEKKKELEMREMKLKEEVEEHAKTTEELKKERGRLLRETSAVHLEAQRLSKAQTAVREKENRLNILINAQESRPMKRRRVSSSEKSATSVGSVEPGLTPFSFSSTQGTKPLPLSLRGNDSRRPMSRPRPVSIKQRGVRLKSFTPQKSSVKRSMPGVAQRR